MHAPGSTQACGCSGPTSKPPRCAAYRAVVRIGKGGGAGAVALHEQRKLEAKADEGDLDDGEAAKLARLRAEEADNEEKVARRRTALQNGGRNKAGSKSAGGGRPWRGERLKSAIAKGEETLGRCKCGALGPKNKQHNKPGTNKYCGKYK